MSHSLVVHVAVAFALSVRESLPASVRQILGFSGPTRKAVCGCCGAEYEQIQIPESFLRAARSKAEPGQAAIDRVIPDGWVPLDCPPCERRNLTGGLTPGRALRYPAAPREAVYEVEERRALQMADS